MRPLVKLQQYDGTGSSDTFLTKFQCMASYLQWDDEDMFHHLCASVEGTVGQFLWDIGPCAVTDQTRFGTQLQAERFKAELRARMRAPGKSIQQLYEYIGRLVTLAYSSSEASLIIRVCKEPSLQCAQLQLSATGGNEA